MAAPPTTTSRSSPGCAASWWGTPRPGCSAGRARSCTCCGLLVCRPWPGWTHGRWLGTCVAAVHCAASSRHPGRWTSRQRWRRPGRSRPGRRRTSCHRSRPTRPTKSATEGPWWPWWTSASRRASSARCTGAARACGCCRTRPRPRRCWRLTCKAWSSRRARAIPRSSGDPWPSRRPSSLTAGPCWASAWGTRSWLARRAPRRGDCASATTPPTTRCATRAPGA